MSIFKTIIVLLNIKLFKLVSPYLCTKFLGKVRIELLLFAVAEDNLWGAAPASRPGGSGSWPPPAAAGSGHKCPKWPEWPKLQYWPK